MKTQLEILDARIPKWDIEHLMPRLCPFCGTENPSLLLRPDKLSVAFCRICGCWYVDVLPSAESIRAFYEGYYHTHRIRDLSEQQVSVMLKNARKNSATNWQLQTLLRLYIGNDRMRILEVGCGLGEFLLDAKFADSDVVGCDISPEACEFANNRLGIMVHQSELHLCTSSIGNVDAVVMRDLIEHPIYPMMSIHSACKILRSGGLLFLLTPNGGEAGTNIDTARNWIGFRVDLEHLQYLTPHTINWLSKECNLRIERLETSGFPYLKGIDKLPVGNYRTIASVKRMAKKIPGMQRMVRTLRAMKNELTGVQNDPRLGSYHLYTILRKI